MKTLIIILIFTGLNFAQVKNYQVNDPNSIDPNEVTIAHNPVQKNTLAAGANISYAYISDSGGKFWTESSLSSSLGVWGDPCVVYDTEGNLFYGHLSNPVFGYWIDRIVIQKSTDNGATWSDGKGIGFREPRNQDKEWIAVDHSNSPFRNNVYVSWTEFDNYGSSSPSDSSRILFSYSTDKGETWSDAETISDVSGDCIDSDNTDEGAVPAVGPDGQIYVCWAGPLGLMFDRSLDGGKTFGEDIFIADIPGGWDFDIPGINRANGLPITACDISNSEFRGNVYVCWGDKRNGSDNSDVFFSRSEDEGLTWSEPIKVNGDDGNKHQFFPWMTVDSTSGIIYISYYDRRNRIGNETDVFLSRSSDGGRTFTDHQISSSSFTPSSNVFFGDYTNITAYEGKITPIWMRLQNGIRSVLVAVMEDSDLITDVQSGKGNQLPDKIKLYQNYPNPFNGTTNIQYYIPEDTFVRLEIYNILGDKIISPVGKYQPRGFHEAAVNFDNFGSGVYVYKLFAGSKMISKKMISLK